MRDKRWRQLYRGVIMEGQADPIPTVREVRCRTGWRCKAVQRKLRCEAIRREGKAVGESNGKQPALTLTATNTQHEQWQVAGKRESRPHASVQSAGWLGRSPPPAPRQPAPRTRACVTCRSAMSNYWAPSPRSD